MLRKNFYIAILVATLSTGILSAATVEALVQLQVGDKIKESTIEIDSEKYTTLSMEKENLGFILRLSNAEIGQERFETTPTRNGKPLMRGFYVGKQMTLGAGSNLNGQTIEKELIVKFLSIKHLS
jgi:hypothetical protein